MEIAKRTYNLTYEQMLLKGTQLTNTEWIIGFVIYTGKETRIMMNSSEGSVKQSDLEKTMNKFTVYIVTWILVMTLTLAIVGNFWYNDASQMKENL